MGMGRNLYRRDDVKSFFIFLCLALTLNRLSSAQKDSEGRNITGTTEEFSPEEFVAENGLSGFYRDIDLPGADRPEVSIYKTRWLSGRGAAELNSILENGSQYRYYVRRRLLEKRMPLCIEYIPVIESSYKPLAVPKSGSPSVGLWQFMENSIENYLRKTKWIDERRDPWKSTDAALLKLEANYRQFGDWLLAIAAYNCGAGAVKRALGKVPQGEKKDFWTLAEHKLIPDHTIAYIPNLLAVSDIVTNSACYGVYLPQVFYDSEYYSPLDDFDYVTVNDAVSIKAIASEIRIDPSILQALNPALLYDTTPADEPYDLRLPRGMKKTVQDLLNTSVIYADN